MGNSQNHQDVVCSLLFLDLKERAYIPGSMFHDEKLSSMRLVDVGDPLFEF